MEEALRISAINSKTDLKNSSVSKSMAANTLKIKETKKLKKLKNSKKLKNVFMKP